MQTGVSGVVMGCPLGCSIIRYFFAAAMLLTMFSPRMCQIFFFVTGQRIKVSNIHFCKEFGSNVLVLATKLQEVFFCFHVSPWTELTQPVLSGQPGLSVSACLYGQVVVTESVHGLSLSQFFISHGAQIFCVLSVQSQITVKFILNFCATCSTVRVMFFLLFYNLFGPDCVRAVLMPCAVPGAEPQDQLAEGTPLHVLLLALQCIVVIGVGVTCFQVFVKFDGSFLNSN